MWHILSRVRLTLFACALLIAIAHPSRAADPAPVHPTDVKGLISFWDFQEDSGQPRVAKGNAYELKEMKGPIARDEDGVFGPYSAKLNEGQWFNLPRAAAPALDIHGKDAQVTVIAWIKRAKKAGRWQAIAGVWDESRSNRQYCLYLDGAKRTDFSTMKREETRNRLHGHVSSVGGPTPGESFCFTYSTGATEIPLNEWHPVAMTYDGKFSRVYLDGKLDAAEHSNPFPYTEGLFDGGKDGADFTVGSVSVGGKPGNFFVGKIGGLAVYDRALSDEELALVCAVPQSKKKIEPRRHEDTKR